MGIEKVILWIARSVGYKLAKGSPRVYFSIVIPLNQTEQRASCIARGGI